MFTFFFTLSLFFIAARVELLRTTALNHVSEIEEVAVEGSGPTFRIPRRYNRYVFYVNRKDLDKSLFRDAGS